MPPRVPRVAIGFSKTQDPPIIRQGCPIGLQIKSLSTTTRYRASTSNSTSGEQEALSSPPSSKSSGALADSPRHQLRKALADLQKDAGSYINASRLQLAIRGIDQSPGKESIRIAILALADGGNSFKKAKQLLRVLLADPLNEEEEEWERVLLSNEAGSRPLLFKVGKYGAAESPIRTGLLQEFNILSPRFEGKNLEILVLEMDPPLRDTEESEDLFSNILLTPTINIPTSTTGRYTPVWTPVHKSLVVADGLEGAGTLLSYHNFTSKDVVETAVDLPISILNNKDIRKSLHNTFFQAVDISLADEAQQTFRKSVEKPWDYENAWFDSNVKNIADWLADGSSPISGKMKPPVRYLIKSLLDNAAEASARQQDRLQSIATSAVIPFAKIHILSQTLSSWSERAHTELRDQLDIAFNGRKWRKLGWWKLFWRVDDVSMIASDIVSQRFLPESEKDIVFLSGRFFEAGVFGHEPSETNTHWAWKAVQEVESGIPRPTLKDLGPIPADDIPMQSIPKPWPLDIHYSRAILASETIPPLQALAQKLVMQTLSTSTAFSSLAGLMYFSGLSATAYEAGAVAALGITWSLRRMQGKWETARTFWEGEVREEGRKAVRATETSLGTTLSPEGRLASPMEGAEELESANKAIEKARAALEACK